MGKNTFTILETPNSISVNQPVNYRYKYPSLRVRTNVEYLIDKHFQVGLSTGLYIRYLDTYYFEKDKTTFSFPLQVNAQYHTSDLKNNLLIGIGGGANFMQINTPPFTDRGGALYTTEIGLMMKKKSKLSFSYLLGFEHQVDNVLFRFESPRQTLQSAYIHYEQFRNQVFFSAVATF